MLSFDFILNNNPKSISKASPPEEINKTGLNISPTNRPKAPKNCKRIISSPNPSNLNRMNSLFM